jgi:hypothetical protein
MPGFDFPYSPQFTSLIGYDQVTANVTITSTTQSAGTSVIAGSPYYFDGTPVIAEFFCPLCVPGAGASGGGNFTYACLFEGSTEIAALCAFDTEGTSVATNAGGAMVGKIRFTPTQGIHTYSVTAFRGGTANTTLRCGAGGTGNLGPMYLRFDKDLMASTGPVVLPGAEIGYDQITTGVSVSSSTEATGTTVINCSPYVFDGQPVWAEFFTPVFFYPGGTSIGAAVGLFEGATQISRFLTISDTAGGLNGFYWPAQGRFKFTPTAGTHTYTVTSWRAGTGNTNIGAGPLGTAGTSPCYCRFVKV